MNPGQPTPPQTASRRLEFDPTTGDLRVLFPYDPELLPVVRSLPGRRWHPQSRHWSVPKAHADEAVEQLASYGFAAPVEAPERSASDRVAESSAEADPAATPSSDESSSHEPASHEPTRGRGLVPGLPTRFDDAQPVEEKSEAEAKTLSVSLLNEWVRGKLLAAFPAAVWLTGEVIGYDRNAHKKHIYFQLAEKVDGDDRPRAVVGAVLFDRERRMITRRLEGASERLTLGDGLKIRVRAKVDLYVVTGSYQIVVEEIDPSFTLGDIAQRRERILADIDKRGLRERNRSRPFPRPTFRVGLITSFESDAYNDLVNELQASRLPFDVAVRDVHVQGRYVERDVLSALAAFAEQRDSFDVVVIVRGGGSRTDLMAFDSLAIAVAVAEHPVKVLIGIGHHRDQSVLDFIAHSEKTPTAIGKRLVELAQAELEFIRESHRRVIECATRQLQAAREAVTSHTVLFARTSQLRLAEARTRLSSHAHSVQVRLAELLGRERNRLADRAHRLANHLVRDTERRREQLERFADRLPRLAQQAVAIERERTEVRSARLRSADPARLLERGFARLLDGDGKTIKSVSQVVPGDSIGVRLSDGQVRATIDDVSPDPVD